MTRCILGTYLLTSMAGLASAGLSGAVAVTGGLVAGVAGKNPLVSVFEGIPYATPPTGDLRWKPPTAPAVWRDIRKADRFGNDCIHPGPQAAAGSEDCLYLNIWTGASTPGEGRPVAVFLPGAEGASSLHGEILAVQGVVVVSANSRTGLMGFLAHPDLTAESDRKASGNYGLLDQIAVLEWVGRNIAGFGGNAKNITVIGPAVVWLAGSPLAKGMLTRAIAAAGGAAAIPLAEAEKAGAAFAEAENAHSMRFLRPMEANDLVQATVEEHYYPGPVVDGWVLKPDWQTAVPPGVQLRTADGTFDPAAPTVTWLNFIKEGSSGSR